MPHGDTEEWAFEEFKNKARAAGGVITDDVINTFKEEMARGLNQSRDNMEMMEEEDYI